MRLRKALRQLWIAKRKDPEQVVGLGALALHTLGVYICAIHLSPWLVGRWFAWFAPALHISTSTLPADWYLLHLEIVSIIPAFLAGYFIGGRPPSMATWSWCVPTLVLVYNMLLYHSPASALTGGSTSTFKYFFAVQHSMPTIETFNVTNPVRVLRQMTVTAPFYAGVAYSLGALAGRKKQSEHVRNLFRRKKPTLHESV